jgi:large conductance mechanosensitive channel
MRRRTGRTAPGKPTPAKREEHQVLKGFKDFVMRGNVIDLAVAVVIGTAFAALVKAFADAFINPLIKVIMGGGVQGGQVPLDDRHQNVLDFGLFINSVITFLITAAVVYFIFVMPMQKLLERRKRGEEPEVEATPEDIALLQEIRDLLRQRAL